MFQFVNLACGDQIAAARVLARMEPRVIQCLVTARVLLDTTGHSVTPGAITETMASIVLRNVDAKTVNILLDSIIDMGVYFFQKSLSFLSQNLCTVSKFP